MDEQEHALDRVSEAAKAIHQQPDASAALQEIVAQALRCLPEFEHVTLARVAPDQSLETLAATTELARAFDAAHSAAKEGPCLDATDQDDVVTIRHARHEQRWPAYVGRALELGLLSQVGVRLRNHADGVMCLNLYSTSHDGVDEGSVGVAEHFAIHAGIALGHVEAAEQLHTAIGTRTVIGTAVGILMERFQLSRDQAFGYLVRQSSTSNRKLREIAREVVDEADRDPGELLTPDPL